MLCVRHLPNLLMVPANMYLFAGTIIKFGKCLTQTILSEFADQRQSFCWKGCILISNEKVDLFCFELVTLSNPGHNILPIDCVSVQV